jgi:hypothetical protein
MDSPDPKGPVGRDWLRIGAKQSGVALRYESSTDEHDACQSEPNDRAIGHR